MRMKKVVIDVRPIDVPEGVGEWERITVVTPDIPIHGRYAVLLLGMYASFFQSKTVAKRQYRKALYELHLVGKVFDLFGFSTDCVEFRRPDIDVTELDF